MIGSYDVLRNGRVVGRCSVSQQGLYYCFDCSCQPKGGGVLRLWVRCGEHSSDLGVLIPEGQNFTLRRKIPKKSFRNGEMSFYIQEKEPKRDKFIPVYPEEPFAYLARIKDSYYEQRDGRAGIGLKEKG